MPVQLEERREGEILVVRVTGQFDKRDYDEFTPVVDRLVKQHGKIRVLFDMQDFRGWDAAALWEDVKFATTHVSDIERIAMVGEKKWQAGMATFCKPFTTATVRYFDQAESDQADTWLSGG